MIDNNHNVVSYGAGTQSTALILMALNGEYNLPRPEFAVFCDTGAEPEFIYDYFDYFQKFCKKKYGFDIYLTKKNGISLYEKLISKPKASRNGFYTSSVPPFFTLNPDGTKGMLMRQCTSDYKTHPTNSFIRKQVGKKQVVNLWLGMSFDERSRMRISTVKWRKNKYPLVDNFLRRKDAIDYVKSTGAKTPQRSSCFFCPFHSDRYWKWLKKEHKSEFIKACELEQIIQSKQNHESILKSIPFFHRSCKPLGEIDFNADTQMDMFPELIDECEGYCGI
jgi:hypothetical protein